MTPELVTLYEVWTTINEEGDWGEHVCTVPDREEAGRRAKRAGFGGSNGAITEVPGIKMPSGRVLKFQVLLDVSAKPRMEKADQRFKSDKERAYVHGYIEGSEGKGITNEKDYDVPELLRCWRKGCGDGELGYVPHLDGELLWGKLGEAKWRSQ